MAIEKTFYGNSSAQKIKVGTISGASEATVSSSPGLLWGYTINGTGTGEIKDDTSVIAYAGATNAVSFCKPIPFETSLKVKLSAAGSKATVYYE